MRVLEPFFNKNNDENYSRLKNVAKEILAMQGESCRDKTFW
jgi:hypothetical protein